MNLCLFFESLDRGVAGKITEEAIIGNVLKELIGGGSPPWWARDENATTPTPEGGGSCGHAFLQESLPATGTSLEGRGECACSKWTLHEVAIFQKGKGRTFARPRRHAKSIMPHGLESLERRSPASQAAGNLL